MPADLFLGIDCGTQSIRAALFAADGRCLGAASQTYVTKYPQPGWAEQSPADWWQGLVGAVRSAVEGHGHRLGGIGVDAAACTMLAVDRQGAPIGDAIMWMDTRAQAEAGELCAALGETPPRAWEFGPAKLLWLKRAKPEAYAAAHAFCEAGDWLTLQLTGELTASIDTAYSFWLYSREKEDWPRALCSRLGLVDALPRLPSRVLPLGAPTGRLTASVAQSLGLPEGVPVFRVGSDVMSAAIGLNAFRPGRFGGIMGSSTILSTFSAEPVRFPGVKCMRTSLGLYRLSASQPASGSTAGWVARQFSNGDIPSFELWDAEAEAIGPGAGGVMFTVDLQGNRTPHDDPGARGHVWGLSLHTRQAEIYRAALEGTAYGVDQLLVALSGAGVTCDEIFACGGISRSPLWMQIHSDVTGRVFHVVEEQHSTSLGSAIIAAAGSGYFKSLKDAADAMVRVAKTYRPNPASQKAYSELSAIHREVYPAMKRMQQRLAEVRQRAQKEARP